MNATGLPREHDEGALTLYLPSRAGKNVCVIRLVVILKRVRVIAFNMNYMYFFGFILGVGGPLDLLSLNLVFHDSTSQLARHIYELLLHDITVGDLSGERQV